MKKVILFLIISPYINATYSQPVTNPPSISSNVSNIPTNNTNPPHTMSQPTISQSTYINSSISISEPIKPFDGIDHNYTPEGNLQHIEARVTFALGLQPTSDHELKFWHARIMVFIQCSLTGTALSWYIRSNDTNKQDWLVFVQAFKSYSHHRKTLTVLKLKHSTLLKKYQFLDLTKQYVILHLKFNS